MENKLAQFASLSQKDKAPAYLSLLPEILSRSNPSAVASDLHIYLSIRWLTKTVLSLVVGRQVLSELVKSLSGGAIKDTELRKRVVEDTLATIQPRIVSYEEQVSIDVIIINTQMILMDIPRSIRFVFSWPICLRKKKNGVKLLGF